MKQKQIFVLGASQTICSKKAYKMAEEVGKHLAKENCITLTGGGLGVMEAALKGAKSEGGLTCAIIPWESIKKVNDYADVVIATGIGWTRDAINLNSCDGAIIVGGGAGTLNEASYGYMMRKPMVAIKSSGGIAEQLAGNYLDVRKSCRIGSASNAKDAVNKILKLIKEREEKGIELSLFDKDLKDTEEKQDWKKIITRRKKELKRKVIKK